MSSIMTNTAAMTALSTLQQTNKNMEMTQNRISTGLRVATATDNAAYWSIATTMRTDNNALSTVRDALGLGAATIDVAYTALESTIDVVDEIKSKLVAARQPGIDRAKVQAEVAELQNQLVSIGSSAVFQGKTGCRLTLPTLTTTAPRRLFLRSLVPEMVPFQLAQLQWTSLLPNCLTPTTSLAFWIQKARQQTVSLLTLYQLSTFRPTLIQTLILLIWKK